MKIKFKNLALIAVFMLSIGIVFGGCKPEETSPDEDVRIDNSYFDIIMTQTNKLADKAVVSLIPGE